MKRLEDFIKILEALRIEDVDFILIGGIAVIIHGFPRFSEDVDIVIKMNEDNIAKIRNALLKLYKDEDIKEITFDELSSYSVLRYISPNEDIIDIIGNLGESYNFNNIDFTEIEIEGKYYKVATPKVLIDMKSNTYREKDKTDLLFLKNLIANQG
ncbi:MAG: nucleotidyl transferase AbiEii/AbiGii toxin family protein [Candidatus Kapabacteria bacterium]|nr:nucleotidyl transferase AbiEii/AbiGii toxin family protein [Candidatus Kapabacteria bacterium]